MPAFTPPYVLTLAVTVIACVGLVLLARRLPARRVVNIDRALAAVLVITTVSWVWTTLLQTQPSWSTSLPVALCDLATGVAAAALWWRHPLAVELTYFWGLAGTLQSLLTPDVQARFPSVEFLEYVVAHAGIVAAALLLVVGQRIVPRPGAALRVYAITAGYTAVVGVIDWLSGGDYMYLAHLPPAATLLSILGPWPWYVLSAAGLAAALLAVLDVPFWGARRRALRPVSG